MDLIGKTISHYRILEKLGEGGMGVVCKAEDTRLKRTVALKFLAPELTRHTEARQRFLREAQAAAGLNHPGIVTVYEIGESQDPSTKEKQTFIAMEFVEGETLGNVAGARHTVPLPVRDVIDYAVQIADALKAAHDRGIIHRDIKPGNILVDRSGRVKIADFGLARIKGVTILTRDNSVPGTLQYMAPEQFQNKKVDHRSDIWSLGVVLYEMLTGKPPFAGEYEQAVIYSILNEEPEPVSAQRSEVPHSAERVLQKALHKTPASRYPDMEAFKTGLVKIRKEITSVETKEQARKSDEASSIVVLPFVNMSTDQENEYFSDGLTEELINALTKIGDLRVVARTSSFVFKGKDLDVREIGERLNVGNVLEGSVRKAGNRIRVTAQLIDVKDGYHVWSERYDRDLEDIFAVQDEIAREIAEKLKSGMMKGGEPAIQRATADVSAYELYLKGRYCSYKFSHDLLYKAIEHYKEAISIDPDFALAYAGLAEAYVFLENPFGLLTGKVAMPKAKQAAEKALELDENLTEAYVSLGAIATYYNWDKEKAHNCFERAISLNPNHVNARIWYELALSLLDQDFDQAIKQLEIALNVDPLNLLVMGRLGYDYYYKYDFDTAIKYFTRIIQLEPNHTLGYHGLMDAHGMKGDYKTALSYGEIVVEMGNYAPPYVGVMGLYCGRSGDNKRARALLDRLLDRAEKGVGSPFEIAVIYMGLGELDKMFEWLETAFKQRDSNLLYLFAPPFDQIREDARFIAFRKKMGFDK
jgi:serine/threonine-protein kinase